jgi:hypothetical protein
MRRKARGKTQVDRRIQRQQGLRAMCLREASGKDGFKKNRFPGSTFPADDIVTGMAGDAQRYR